MKGIRGVTVFFFAEILILWHTWLVEVPLLARGAHTVPYVVRRIDQNIGIKNQHT